MLLATTTLVTLRCSSGGATCPDGTHVYGFCADGDAQVTDASGIDVSGFYGFWDASIDATYDDAGDASDAAEDEDAPDGRDG